MKRLPPRIVINCCGCPHHLLPDYKYLENDLGYRELPTGWIPVHKGFLTIIRPLGVSIRIYPYAVEIRGCHPENIVIVSEDDLMEVLEHDAVYAELLRFHGYTPDQIAYWLNNNHS